MDGFKGQKVQDVKKVIQKMMVDNVRGSVHTVFSVTRFVLLTAAVLLKSPLWAGSGVLCAALVAPEREILLKGILVSGTEWDE